jgi:hypothetical protein
MLKLERIGRWSSPAFILPRCGLGVVTKYGDYDASPLGDTSPDMIFVAEKSTP